MPGAFSLPNAGEAFDNEGRIVDKEILADLEKFADAAAEFFL